MKPLYIFALAIALGAAPALAAEKHGGQLAAASAQAYKAQGTVQKVDAMAGIVNLSHGPIPSLNWPAMTMDFRVKDTALLKDVNHGQKVEVAIVQEGPGQFIVTRITPLN